MRCHQCLTQITPSTLEPNGSSIILHKNFLEFEAAAQAGCELCSNLLYNMKAYPDGTTKSLGEYDRLRKDIVQPVLLSWRVSKPIQLVDPARQRLNHPAHKLVLSTSEQGGSMDKSQLLETGSFIIGELPAGTTRDVILGVPSVVEAAKFAAYQIKCCDTDKAHTSCRMTRANLQSPSAHPSRLIEIVPTEKAPKLRVVEWINNIGMDRYVTVSYRWGVSQHDMMSWKHNIAARMRSLPLTDLPRVFQEAVGVCLSLNIRYLWIDALCILQPTGSDNRDWLNQSAIMEDIYANAYLTIAFAGGEDVTRGCYDKQMPLQHTPPRYIRLFTSDKVSGVWVQGMKSLELRYGLRNPLTERGWTMQEQILSVRTLMCFPHGYIFKCQMGMQGNDHESSQRGHSVLSTRLGELGYPSKDLKAEGFSNLGYWSSYYWDAIVEEYTKRKLTTVSDRLHAISALAKRVGSLSGDQYAAGLWRSSLRTGLLWRVDARTKSANRHPTSIGPSWSWVSVRNNVYPHLGALDTPLEYNNAIISLDSRETKVTTTPLDINNKYGSIAPGATLAIRTVIRHNITATRRQYPSSDQEFAHHIRSGTKSYDCSPDNIFNAPGYCVEGCQGTIEFDTTEDMDVKCFSIALIDVRLSGLAAVRNNFYPLGCPGLAIVRVENSAEYRRIGLVRVQNMCLLEEEMVEEIITLI